MCIRKRSKFAKGHFRVFVGQRVIYPGGFFAQIATAMPFLEVPPAYFRTMVNALGGRYDYELDLYTVDCKQIDSLPPITITLFSGEDRITYGVQAHDFVAKIVSIVLKIPFPRKKTVTTQCDAYRCVVRNEKVRSLVIPNDSVLSSQFQGRSSVRPADPAVVGSHMVDRNSVLSEKMRPPGLPDSDDRLCGLS